MAHNSTPIPPYGSRNGKRGVHLIRALQLEPFSITALIFATSIVTILLFWVMLPDSFHINENRDYKAFYEPVARRIIAGDGLTNADGTPALRYPPGYPLILAGLFGVSHLLHISQETALAALSLLSMGLTSVFVFMLARSIWSTRPALVAALVWMTYPFALWLTKQPNSEISFLVVFYGAFYLFWDALLRRSRAWSTYFLIGFLMGLAMLIRPIAIGTGFLMGVLLWIVRRDMTARLRFSLAIVVLLGNLMAISPWETWAYATTGRVIVLSTGGVPGIQDGLTFALARAPKGYRQIVKVPQDVTALMQDIYSRSSEMKSLGAVASVMGEKLQTQPLAVTKLFSLKAIRSWYGTDSGRFELPNLLIQGAYLFLVLWGSRTAWRRGGAAKDLTISVWLIALYFWGMTTLVLSILRYMVPAIGLLFVLLPGVLFKRENAEAKLSADYHPYSNPRK
jgi:4-amino-4-deoxy-L-arabinose transferase-like glycosyltransferase